jgi:hypothetical protein
MRVIQIRDLGLAISEIVFSIKLEMSGKSVNHVVTAMDVLRQ